MPVGGLLSSPPNLEERPPLAPSLSATAAPACTRWLQLLVVLDPLSSPPVTRSNYPKYLSVVLDRTLTFKNHLVKLSAKIKTRHNLIAKLSGTL